MLEHLHETEIHTKETPPVIYRGSSDIKKGWNALRQHGFFQGFVLIYQAVCDRLAPRYARWDGRRFDRKHNVQTTGNMYLPDLTVKSSQKDQSYPYEPTPVKVITLLLSSLRDDFSDFSLVDLGSGKGRVLLIASNFNFKSIVGVEFAEELHKIAQNNINLYRHPLRQCHQIETVCMDAAQFTFPEDKCVIFFSNPFKKELLLSILKRIEKAYLSSPRKIYIVFYNPRHVSKTRDEILTQFPWLRRRENLKRISKYPSFMTSHCDYAIYESKV
jgi:SAM-dependent methyltransferase